MGAPISHHWPRRFHGRGSLRRGWLRHDVSQRRGLAQNQVRKSACFSTLAPCKFFGGDFVSVPALPICLINEALKTHVSEEALAVLLLLELSSLGS